MSAIAGAATRAERRYDLDWLRIIAFGLLIAYHLGMLYRAGEDWHVKSRWATEALEPLMDATSPWRLTLLFLISGVASRYLIDKLGAGRFARERTMRLLLPLAFAMAVTVAPQAYFEVVTQHGYEGGYLAFWLRYLSFDFSLGTIVPTWNHLWFVAYLLAYALILAALAAWRGLPSRSLRGPALVLVPAALFAVYRVALFPVFDETHKFIDDVYAHAHYFTAFALGFLVAKDATTWTGFVALRRPFLLLAIASYAIGYGTHMWFERADLNPLWWRALALPCIRELFAWSTIGALIGYGRLHLNRDGGVRRYLTEAVFPYYILHQTLIIVIWGALQSWEPGPIAEPIIVGLGTVAGCVLGFEIVRRVPLLRPLFGLKPLDRRQSLSGPAAAIAPAAAGLPPAG